MIGEDGQPLPQGETVFRLAYRPKDYPDNGAALPIAFAGSFTLSTTEKHSPPSRLSVFALSRTNPEQGWQIAGAKHDLVLYLSVDDIRSLRVECQNANLDVVWHTIDSDLPGAEGHAGIIGLDAGDSKARKFVRMRLADISVAKSDLNSSA